MRQSKKHAIWNQTRREAFRNAIKKAGKAASIKEALEFARTAQQALAKAAKRGVIKKNTAARKLSRLMARVNKMKK